MDPVIVEPERDDDALAVDTVVRRAFHEHPSVGDMVAAIRTSPEYEPGLAFVARKGDDVVGFVMISHAALEDDDGTRHDVLTLSPLAVDPGHEREGIGSALVQAVLDAARQRTDLPRLVTLEGSPTFYGRLGFVFAPDHGVRFDLPDWAPPDAAQLHLLDGVADGAPRGRVVYPPAFALADD
ncbi:GNAT family N-acetyltransferase [Jatrophihabitans sp. YIM 134969]